jgi:hypothetical protein
MGTYCFVRKRSDNSLHFIFQNNNTTWGDSSSSGGQLFTGKTIWGGTGRDRTMLQRRILYCQNGSWKEGSEFLQRDEILKYVIYDRLSFAILTKHDRF